jgi:uncharacterized membrane protein
MKKKEFIKELNKNLKGLSKEDREEIIEDYEEHFEIGKKKKREESEIAKSLGNPKQIAKQAKLELMIAKAEDDKSVGNIFRVVFATIGLSFFNLVFVVGIFFGLLGILIGLIATGIAISVTGIAVLLVGIFYPAFSQFIYFVSLNPLAVILAGICLASFGILFLIGTWYVGKGFYIITIRYVKFNVKIIRGKLK